MRTLARDVVDMTRGEAAQAIEHVRRAWPADEARALLELPAREVAVVLELALLGAVPVGEGGWPRRGEPIARVKPDRGMPPELATILRRLGSSRAPAEPVVGEQVQLDVDASGSAATLDADPTTREVTP